MNHRITRKPHGLRRHPAAGIACMLMALAAGLKAHATDLPAAGIAAQRDLVMVIDVSTEMAGPALAQARAGVEGMLDRLAPTERFNIVTTGPRNERLFPESAPAAPAYLDLARRYLRALDAGGRADVEAALQLARDGHRRPGWTRQVVLVGREATDRPVTLATVAHGGPPCGAVPADSPTSIALVTAGIDAIDAFLRSLPDPSRPHGEAPGGAECEAEPFPSDLLTDRSQARRPLTGALIVLGLVTAATLRGRDFA